MSDDPLAELADIDLAAATTTAPNPLADVPFEVGVPKPDPILVADGVRRQYGGLVAVDVDHVEIQRGLITALIGPNGAGKSTFFNLLTGFDEPDHGHWTFEGDDVTGTPGHKLARAGMVRTFQLTKALAVMSVLDNMLLAARNPGERLALAALRPTWRSAERDARERALDLLQTFGLASKASDYAGTLSGGSGSSWSSRGR